MLTKDLLRFRSVKGQIRPRFISVEDPDLLELAQALIACYDSGIGATRERLQEQVQQVLEAFSGDAQLAKGFDKLLQDRSEFSSGGAEDLPALRARVFAVSAQYLQQGLPETAEAFREQLQNELNEPPESLMSRLYGDLPPYHPLESFRSLSAEGLLRRYNLSLVQSLLLYCDRLEVTLPEPRPAELRQVLKYLRFHQLLARWHRDEQGGFRLEVEGPMSLYAQSQKYGLNLASFFPAVLHQSNWSCEALVQVRKNRPEVLKLDASCGLQPVSRRFLAYVPEELTRLQQLLAQKLPEWSLAPASDFLILGGEVHCFPDYELTHTSGVTVFLELFHPWHAGPLKARLAQLSSGTQPPLLLGVMRRLLKEEAVEAAVEASTYFAHSGFFFREIPTLEALKPLLQRRLQDAGEVPLLQATGGPRFRGDEE